jgi:hypothetical protein
MNKVLLSFVFLLVFSCQKTNNTDIFEPNNGPNEVVDTDWCPKAELNLKKLQCKARDGSFMHENFTSICEEIQEEGGIFVNPRCVATSSTCDEIKKCPPS